MTKLDTLAGPGGSSVLKTRSVSRICLNSPGFIQNEPVFHTGFDRVRNLCYDLFVKFTVF